MDMQALIKQKGLTRYRLSKLSGVPKTTVADICAGRSDIAKCSAGTVQRLAWALDCSMEDIMELETYPAATGLPKDRAYLECGLPGFLQASLDKMKEAWQKTDNGEEYTLWDCDFCELQSDINNAEVNGIISSEQAWYLREKYLRIERV